MSRAKSINLGRFMEERAGDHLRSVVYYGPDEYERVLNRSDVLPVYTSPELEEIVDDVRLEGLTRRRQEDLHGFGGLTCTVRCFDRGVVMHLPHDDQHGTVIIMDYAAATHLHTFIADTLNQIHDEYPPKL